MPNDDDFAILWLDEMSIRKEMVSEGRVEARQGSNLLKHGACTSPVSLNQNQGTLRRGGHQGLR